MADEFDDQLNGLLMELDAGFDDLPPVPTHLHQAALDAFGWRNVDAVLAELLFDSDADALTGVRQADLDADPSAGPRRSFRFGANDSVIRMHLTAESLVVMIEPPLSIACRIASGYRGGNVSEHRTDEIGELVIDAPELPVRIELDFPAGPVVTPWIIG